VVVVMHVFFASSPLTNQVRTPRAANYLSMGAASLLHELVITGAVRMVS
jgi:hypothetical protein